LARIELDLDLAERLIRSQCPQYAGALVPVAADGTDHVLFRIGDTLAARFPVVDGASRQVWSDQLWLPLFGEALSVPVPRQLAVGQPAFGYPFHWSIVTWLPGAPLSRYRDTDDGTLVDQLCRLLQELRAAPTNGGPDAEREQLRGRPLRFKDAATRSAIAELPQSFDPRRLVRVWDACAAVPDHSGTPVWFHGDLLPGNILADGTGICGLIDFGGPGVGDPACDFLAAWYCLRPRERRWFRERLDVARTDWLRGIGHTFSQAVIYIPYYFETRPAGVRMAAEVLASILDEWESV